jgi:dihydrofolate synthase / folylpolyglutamate synthase
MTPSERGGNDPISSRQRRGAGIAASGAPGGSERWSEARAEAHLRSLELFGMRFGLEKMRRMMTALGSPQLSYGAIHILGTNGKTSTARMTAAILERHGVRTGTYTSPHLISYRERVQVDEREVSGEDFAAAIARAVWASQRVNRTLSEDDHVTQFELLTAAALWEMARRGVAVAVVEAGLGGRYDATSVVRSQVTVLTNVALEHTRWLGPTVKDIAEEKLAVLRPAGTLVLGPGLEEAARAVAARVAGERGARTLAVGRAELAAVPALRAAGRFQRENFALARLAAEAYLHGEGVALEEAAVLEAARVTAVRGRMQLVSEDPPTLFDGAHNPHAVDALARSVADLLGGRPLALVMGVLEDKDAAAMLERLLALCERAWFTAPPSPRALSPAALESRARQLRFEHAASEPEPRRALAHAQEWARAHGGAVLVTGSVYLVGELLGELDREGAAQGPRAQREGGTG